MMDNPTRNASDYIRSLYDETQEGVLEIWYEDETEDGDTQTYTMTWNQQDMQTLVQEFEALRGKLDRIAAGEPSEELNETFRIYVLPYDDHPFDKEELEKVLEKVEYGQPCSNAEYDLYDRYIQWRKAQAAARLEDRGQNADGLISRARRYTRLMELHAPAIVVENEARSLAEELVLYRFAQ